MRSNVLAALVLCAIAVLLIAQTPQQAPPPFLTVAFCKVPPANFAAYEEVLGSMSRKLMQTVIDSGELRSWVATKMVSPVGSEAPCNYAMGQTWSGAPRLDMAPAELDKFYQKAGIGRGAYTDRMQTLGATLVKREIWRGPLTRAGEYATAGDFIRFDCKHVPQGQAYAQAERDVYQPIWGLRVKQGTLKGWGCTTSHNPAAS